MASPDKSSRVRPTGPFLDSQVSYRLGVPLVYVRGELDHASADSLRDVVERELAAKPNTLILEFSGLSFIDSGGLSYMFDLARKFREPGWLGVVGANRGVSRLLEMTGLAEHPEFRMLPDLGAASAALAADGYTRTSL